MLRSKEAKTTSAWRCTLLSVLSACCRQANTAGTSVCDSGVASDCTLIVESVAYASLTVQLGSRYKQDWGASVAIMFGGKHTLPLFATVEAYQ